MHHKGRRFSCRLRRREVLLDARRCAQGLPSERCRHALPAAGRLQHWQRQASRVPELREPGRWCVRLQLAATCWVPTACNCQHAGASAPIAWRLLRRCVCMYYTRCAPRSAAVHHGTAQCRSALHLRAPCSFPCASAVIALVLAVNITHAKRSAARGLIQEGKLLGSSSLPAPLPCARLPTTCAFSQRLVPVARLFPASASAICTLLLLCTTAAPANASTPLPFQYTAKISTQLHLFALAPTSILAKPRVPLLAPRSARGAAAAPLHPQGCRPAGETCLCRGGARRARQDLWPRGPALLHRREGAFF